MAWLIAYCAVIVVVAAVGLWIAVTKRNAGAARATATIVTMMGVLGTFLGVAWSLRGFNVTGADIRDTQESVQNLLLGMKGAFWSSVAGIASALIVRLLTPILVPVDLDERTLSDLIEALREEGSATRDLLSHINDGLLALPATADALSAAVSRQHETSNQEAADSRATLTSIGEVVDAVHTGVSRFIELAGDLHTAQDALHSHVNALTALNTDAEQAAPILEQRLTALVDAVASSFSTSVERSKQASSQAIEQAQATFGDLADAVTQQHRSLHTQTGNAVEAIGDMLSGATAHHEQLRARTDEGLDLVSDLLKEAAASLSLQQAQTKQLMDESAAHFKQVDAQIGDELSQCLTHLGQHLTALSEKFVADYGPLTERLRAVVEIGRDIRRGETGTV